MKIKLHWLAAICLLLSSQVFFAQQTTNNERGLNYAGESQSMRIVPSLASRSTLIPAVPLIEEPKDGRHSSRKSKFDVVPGKDPQTLNDFYTRNPGRLDKTIRLNRALENDFVINNNVGSPSDPAIGLGLNHALVVYNTGFIIYDKEGNDLTGPLNVNNIFSNGGCCDLTVSYDNAADRWVLTYLFIGAGMELAVSDGPDPTTANWVVYTFPQINDYNKLSVWRDGYYITDNGNSDVWAIDRTAALAGDASANIQGFVVDGINSPNNGFTSAQVLNITNDDHPTTGGAPMVYMRDDGFINVTEDEIWIWTINVDFATPTNSNVSAPEEFTAMPFINVFDGGAFENLTQPGGGTDIDAIQSTIMNQAQFRKFPTYNSAIFNFVVDTDATAGELAGIRWYEFRQNGDGQPWAMFQEGTFNAPDGKHAWMGSMAMDSQGNIGLGYSSMAGPTTPNPTENTVGAFYTGRFASDDTGVMSLAEVEIGKAGNITGTRFGDYGKMDVDPSDDKNFWFITEYQNTNHVAVFRIAPNTTNDVGVVSIDTPMDDTLTNIETVTVTVFNYGEDPASGFDVNYQVGNGAAITETFVGTLASQTSAQFTFSTTADLSTEGQTYAITSCTILAGDEDNDNDCTSINVTHMAADDIGITEISAPNSGEGLGSETVTITIQNVGSANQSGFDVNYVIDGGTPVVETVTATVTAGNTISYSFTTPANLSSSGEYSITASTLLVGDSDSTNDTASKTVVNFDCASGENSNSSGISDNGTPTESIINITENKVIAGINVTVNIFKTNAGDLEVKLVGPDNTEVMLSNLNGGTGSNFVDTIFDDDASTDIASGAAPFTGSFVPDGDLSDFDGLSSVGDWTLVVTDKNGNGVGGALSNWSIQLCANNALSIDDSLVDADDFEIIYKGNDQYLVKLSTTSINERLEFSVKTVLGQTLLWKTLENETGQGYEYKLDMSYASSGIYFVRIGNNRAGNVKRIVVE